MYFSLVMGTVGRVEELERFLYSLDMQTYRNFELIIVDQNKDDRIIPKIKKYKNKFKIIHLKSEPGLSKARNIGLEYCQGDIIGFPDDDCYYPPFLIENIANLFKENKIYDGITGSVLDLDMSKRETFFHKKSGWLTVYNVWKRSISFTIFLKHSIVSKVGLFDEELGVGAGTIWGSGEETDFLVRAIKKKARIYYDTSIIVCHPIEIAYDNNTIMKVFKYGAGMGRVIRKHKYPIWFVINILLRPLVGSILALMLGHFEKSKYYYSMFRGRYCGYFSKIKFKKFKKLGVES